MPSKNDVVSFSLLLLVPGAAGEVPPDAPESNSGLVYSPTMAMFMIILITAFFSVVSVSIYIRRYSSTTEAEPLFARGSDRRSDRGFGEEAISTFPTFLYSSVKRLKLGNGALECAVCLSEFHDHETLRLLPKCTHVFHADCVDVWLSSHDTCPVCRAILVPEPGEALLPVQIPNPDPTQDSPVMTGSSSVFPRSHSTGHSPVRPEENRDRFTLSLPEGVVSQLVNMNRARSLMVLSRVRSERRGFRGGSSSLQYERFDRGTRSDRWSLSMTPPFVFRTGGSGRSTRFAEQRCLLPLFLEPDNVGERSSDPLELDIEGR